MSDVLKSTPDAFYHISNSTVSQKSGVRKRLHSETPPPCTVEADYTVVFFAAGGKNTPGWNWVWKAYRSLSRKYRKNLKKLVRTLPPHTLQSASRSLI